MIHMLSASEDAAGTAQHGMGMGDRQVTTHHVPQSLPAPPHEVNSVCACELAAAHANVG